MVVEFTVEPSTAMLVAEAEPIFTAPWMSCVSELLFTELSAVVCEAVRARLAAVLVAESFDELTL